MRRTSYILLTIIYFTFFIHSLAQVEPTCYAASYEPGLDCYDDYPKQYIAYKLQPNEKIVFDGKLNEPAWNVAWTSYFVDILGPPPAHNEPYYKTRAKLRYDDDYLYVGAHLEEPQGWANWTQNNSIIFFDSDFEVFIDPNGDNHYYKELEMNARNLNWNLILVRPYCDGGPPVCNATIPPGGCAESAPQFGVPWWDISPSLPSGVYVDGVLNNPLIGTKFWSIEIGIPIQQYLRYENRGISVNHGDYWRLDFSRVEWHIEVVQLENGSQEYWKIPNVPEENWVWQPMSKVNMHLPEKWGYIQFSSQSVNSTTEIKDVQWPVRSALMQIYYAEIQFHSKTNKYTDVLLDLIQYGLPRSVVLGQCATIPTIQLDATQGFIATAKHKQLSQIIGHIRSDRLLWVDEI